MTHSVCILRCADASFYVGSAEDATERIARHNTGDGAEYTARRRPVVLPDRRLRDHNSGGSPHTSKFRPWELVAAVALKDEDKAAALERYLKTGSGRAFAAKHPW